MVLCNSGEIREEIVWQIKWSGEICNSGEIREEIVWQIKWSGKIATLVKSERKLSGKIATLVIRGEIREEN